MQNKRLREKYLQNKSITKPYCAKVAKPLVEVPLTGIDDCGNQFNVGIIDLGGNVKFYPISGMRNIRREGRCEWQSARICVIVGYDFGCSYFAIGGNGPFVKCNCLLWPNLCEDLCPQCNLPSASYEYNVKLFYCGYPWTYNNGERPDDIIGWYDQCGTIVYVDNASYNCDCISCTCCVCTMNQQETFTDPQGICWTVTNEISTYCVWETWQAPPDVDSCGHTYMYCQIGGECYVRPIFWCNYCNSKHWAYADKICDPRFGCCTGAVCEWYCWYEATNNMTCCDVCCWNPNNTYFHSTYFDSYKMCYVNGGVSNWRNYNKWCVCALRNYACCAARSKWDPSTHSIPYDRELYNQIKCTYCNSTTHKRTYKGGFISTTNHAICACLCVCLNGTSPVVVYNDIDDCSQLVYGWQICSGYLPIYFEKNCNNAIQCYAVSSCGITGANPNLNNCPWPNQAAGQGCTVQIATPYYLKHCTGTIPNGSYSIDVLVDGQTCAAYCDRTKGYTNGLEPARVWFNEIDNQVYMPLNFCRLTQVYCVCQHCVGTGNMQIDCVNIRVRYRKAKSGVK